MRSILAVLILSVGLAACAGDKETRATSALAVACGSVGQAIETLAPHRGDLSADQEQVVEGIISSTRPYCEPGSTISPANAVSFVENAANQLNTIIGSL